MSTLELKPCPHCGSQPWFSDVQNMDERRYEEKKLECCAVYSASIGWRRYKDMTAQAIDAELTADLIEQWNKRYEPEGDE